MFSSKYCEIFKNTYFEDHLLKVATEKRWATVSVLTLLLSSDNLLTGYEQLRYYEFNQNLSICISLAKDWFKLHKKFNKYLAT